MAWTEPQYSLGKIDKAGKVLAGGKVTVAEMDEALSIMSNWRSSHSYPLEVAVRSLRRAAMRIDPLVTIAERLKRLPSITDKLKRQEANRGQDMKLSRMQDIGGCRAIVRDIDAVNEVVELYTKALSIADSGVIRKADYIEQPKPDGYRSVHFICRYRGKRKAFDGLRIEVQVRSRLQHAWATAVEVASTYTNQNLKAGCGEQGWLHFFALMASFIACLENRPTTPDTPSNSDGIRRELKTLASELRVGILMERWSSITRIYEQKSEKDSRLFLVTLRAQEQHWYITVKSFRESQVALASEEYLQAEKDSAAKRGVQVVLVSVESIDHLQQAYPNYYADTKEFLKTLQMAF
jgi:hypothetical protein